MSKDELTGEACFDPAFVGYMNELQVMVAQGSTSPTKHARPFIVVPPHPSLFTTPAAAFLATFISNEVERRLAYEIGQALAQLTIDGLNLMAALRQAATEPQRSFKLDKLASVVGMSRTKCSSVARRELGSSVERVLMRLRIERCTERLRTTTDPIKQVSYETGFATPSHFCHAFKALLRMTPSTYRRRSRLLSSN